MSSYVAGQILTASQLNTDFAIASGTPIGTVILWGGATTSLPAGYILCDGSSYSTSGTYANLYNVIGYRYGGSAGTFYVPKLNAGYIPIGTSTLNADGSRQTTSPSITLSTSNVASTGHTHTYTFNLNTAASSGHTHSHNSIASDGVDHSHLTVSLSSDNTHTHTYFKPNSGANNTTLATNNHNHTGSTNSSTAYLHTHSAPSHATTNADTAHGHSVLTQAWTANADTGHAHTVAASYMVFVIRYAYV